MKKENIGRILRIERASLHDGDGLRTVVFLNGCPLRCLWCSTPESQRETYQFGFWAGRCTGCGKCAAVCPSGAIQMKDGTPVRDESLCVHCRACEKACLNRAWQIYGHDMSVEELEKEIAKDEIFYFHSGGGVTFSGGEPLMQFEFVAEVMRRCHEHGIHTAMETSMYAKWEAVERVLPHLDFLFVDLKVMDRERHLAAAGVDCALIHENLKKIEASPYPLKIHVRIPVIPGINNDKENLKQTVEFCDSLTKISEIELLPYHRLGVETYRNLKREYALKETVTPSVEEMEGYAAYMNREAKRVRVYVGG